VILFEAVCSCHATAARRAADVLERMCRDEGNITHAAKFAAELVGPGTLVVITRNSNGELSWQLLPRAA
jgi:hypothetical protein